MGRVYRWALITEPIDPKAPQPGPVGAVTVRLGLTSRLQLGNILPPLTSDPAPSPLSTLITGVGITAALTVTPLNFRPPTGKPSLTRINPRFGS